MSKILVVEPHKILQRAIAVSLFPEHGVELADTIPASAAGAIKGYDAVVIDAAALRERNELSSAARRAVQGWHVPIVWIEDRETPSVPLADKVVVVRKPIVKNELILALTQCLRASTAAPITGKTTASDQESKASTSHAAKTIRAKTGADEKDARIIELVDVVAEAPARQSNKPTARKIK